jgi:hypothetical protein
MRLLLPARCIALYCSKPYLPARVNLCRFGIMLEKFSLPIRVCVYRCSDYVFATQVYLSHCDRSDRSKRHP